MARWLCFREADELELSTWMAVLVEADVVGSLAKANCGQQGGLMTKGKDVVWGEEQLLLSSDKHGILQAWGRLQLGWLLINGKLA